MKRFQGMPFQNFNIRRGVIGNYQNNTEMCINYKCQNYTQNQK